MACPGSQIIAETVSERRSGGKRINVFLVIESRIAGIAIGVAVLATYCQPALHFVIQFQADAVG